MLKKIYGCAASVQPCNTKNWILWQCSSSWKKPENLYTHINSAWQHCWKRNRSWGRPKTIDLPY